MNDDATALEASSEAADQTFSSDEAGSTTEPCERQEKTWIDLELLDPDGQPVANRKLRITLSDGRVIEGSTDASGLFGVDGIDPGECRIDALDLAEDQCTLVT